jgi:hypothetical protein
MHHHRKQLPPVPQTCRPQSKKKSSHTHLNPETRLSKPV